jgi:hypothetical protein
VEHGKHGTVARRVDELVRVPARGEWAGFGLAVADHAERQEVGIVVDRAVGMHQRVAKLSAFVDRAGRLRSDV